MVDGRGETGEGRYTPGRCTIAELLARADTLNHSSDTPRLDTEILLAHCLERDRTYLFTWPNRAVSPDQADHFRQLLARRQRGEPVAHLTGTREFWSLTLKVSAATLIPRPDTETLVEATLKRVTAQNARVLDLGTGTGAIALALASEHPEWRLVAVDVVPEAVVLARENARHCGIGNIEVLHSDWFTAVDGTFDAIVSNPPYIDRDDPHLHTGDVRFEPASALVADSGGLAAISHIAREGRHRLNTGGWLLVEHGADQGAAVRDIFAAHGYDAVETVPDLAGRERVTLGHR